MNEVQLYNLHSRSSGCYSLDDPALDDPAQDDDARYRSPVERAIEGR